MPMVWQASRMTRLKVSAVNKSQILIQQPSEASQPINWITWPLAHWQASTLSKLER